MKKKSKQLKNPTASYSFTMRLQYANIIGMFGKIVSAIGNAGGDVGAVDMIRIESKTITRDITINARDSKHVQFIIDRVEKLRRLKIRSVSDRTFLMHLGGKLEITSRVPLKTRDDLSMAYTPGVARVCMAIAHDPRKSSYLTIRKNTVGIVSDGTAVLGLGDIGPEAAMPVMEGKAVLFKEFGGVDAFPICLRTRDPEEIINIIKALAPSFGGINLEDVSSPRCFEIEERLKTEVEIPVFHDDQHGTAVVVLAALYNAAKIIGIRIKDMKVVVSGVGAAGVACTKILLNAGVRDVVGCDTRGAIYKGRTEHMNPIKEWYAQHTNPRGIKGKLKDAIKGRNLFLGLSGPGTLTLKALKTMAKKRVVFAMANPTPEILPEIAQPHVTVMATGRSDYPNQINNVLCFPGIFKGALAVQASDINESMKLAAAKSIASIVKPTELSPGYIIPSVFNRSVAEVVSKSVAKVAERTGVCRKTDVILSKYKF